MKKSKKRPLTYYKKRLDAIFSKYIRQKYTKNGIVRCYTCPWRGDPKKAHCGHFVPRQYLKTRWDERNCRPQCFACNLFYNGQPSAFASNLRAEYGDTIVEELEKDRMIPVKLDPAWYEVKIAHYSSLLG